MNPQGSGDQLKQAPWHFLSIDEYRFVVKHFVSPNAHEMLISDLASMWHEQLLVEDVMLRNSELNPDIETSKKIILNHIEQLITREDCRKMMTVQCCNENELKIKSQSSLSTLTFNWEFHLTSVSRSMFAEHLTKPFFGIVAEMSRKHELMVQILKNKDAQIEDYKAEGIVLQRRYRYDQPFDELQFMSNRFNSEEFENLVYKPEENACCSSIQKLYTEVMKHQCQPKLEAPVTAVDEKTSNQSMSTNTISTTTTSNNNFVTDEKDEEIERRRVLEQKLLEEKQKKERKTKKLKL